MPRSRPTIRDLLDQYEDASALAELTARAEEALPVVSRMLRGLDSYLSVTALWYVRVLRLVTTDRVGTALAVSRGLSAEYRQAVAWLARGAFRSDDEPRLRTALSHALAKARRAAARNQQPVSVAGVPAFLLEGLGVVASDRASVTLVEETYALASQEVASLWAAGDVGLALFAPDVEPVAAAAAAALLAFTERGGVPTPAAKQLAAWRQLCVRIALDRPDRGSLSGFGILPPMQFLYAGAPRAAATILVECFRQTEDRDELLTALGGWLRQGPVFGARPTILLSDPGVVALRNELTETLAAGAGDYAHIVTDVLVGLGAPGDTQTERGVVLAALESFLTPMVGADAIGNVLGSLRGLVPFATIAAIAVEDVFRQRVFSSESGAESAAAEVRRELAAAGLSPITGWSWAPPGVAAPEADARYELNRELCRIGDTCRSARRSEPAAVDSLLASHLPTLPARGIVWQCWCRNVLVVMARGQGPAPAEWVEILRTVIGDPDFARTRFVLAAAAAILGRRAGPVYEVLLATPIARRDADVGRRVVAELRTAVTPHSATVLTEYARAVGWWRAEARRDLARSQPRLWSELAGAMGQLAVAEAAPELARLSGATGLGADADVALLRLAARKPAAVADPDYRRAFEAVLRDEYSRLDSDLLGDAAERHIRLAVEAWALPTSLLGRLCAWITEGVGAGRALAFALPPLARRLPAVVRAAVNSPGEAWEDRNWGGYNESEAERLAIAVSDAVLALSAHRYSPTRAAALEAELRAIPDLAPTATPVVTSTATYPNFRDVDLLARLRQGSV